MDRNSIIAFVLIGLLFAGWMTYNSIYEQPVKNDNTSNEIKKDTLIKDKENINKDSLKTEIPNDSVKIINNFGFIFSNYVNKPERIITIETDLLIIKISSNGASIKEWSLKKYDSHYGAPVQLIWNDLGELFLEFETKDDNFIDSRKLSFNFNNLNDDYISLKSNDSLNLVASLDLGNGKYINKELKFFGNKYLFDTKLKFSGIDSLISKNGINYVWQDGLRYQEKNTVDESSDALGIIKTKGNYYEVDASGDEPVSDSKSENIEYVGIKNKYFLSAIIVNKNFDGKATIFGKHYKLDNHGINERYKIELKLPRKEGKYEYSFQNYLGPLDYDIVKSYGLSDAISFGWRWLVRPIGEFFMLPIFKFIHSVVPNFGISIIIFSLLMKILLHPLSIQQMRSAQKMQLLAPEMNAIREKYKDDQQKQSAETMKLYSEYGINPMGGCLPLLLQMPILYALWSVLRGSIDLRHSYFFGWITDLSVPDTIYSWGFSILGLTSISGLALLMGATLFIQQKLTITDPRQKSMIYIMPIMFTFMFSGFPAGLNLYYFMFNLLGILQQIWINKFSKNRLTLEDLKKAPKKEGWFQKKMREAQELAAQQGRSIPGSNINSANDNYNQTKSKYTRKKK